MVTKVIVDTSKRYFGQIAVAATIGVTATIWSVFVRPQVVMASDLQTVVDSVSRLEEKLDQTVAVVNAVAVGQMQQSVLYYEDQIRILHVTQSERPLTPTETQRLLRYEDDLEKIKAGATDGS